MRGVAGLRLRMQRYRKAFVRTRSGRDSPSTPSRIGRALDGRRLRVNTPSKSVDSLFLATQSLRVTRKDRAVDLRPS